MISFNWVSPLWPYGRCHNSCEVRSTCPIGGMLLGLSLCTLLKTVILSIFRNTALPFHYFQVIFSFLLSSKFRLCICYKMFESITGVASSLLDNWTRSPQPAHNTTIKSFCVDLIFSKANLHWLYLCKKGSEYHLGWHVFSLSQLGKWYMKLRGTNAVAKVV